MLKNKKVLIIIGGIILIAIVIGIVSILGINSKNRISQDIIDYIKENIELNNNNLTKEYIDNNISKVTESAATEMVTLYEEYQDKNIERLYNEFKTQILKYNGQYTVDTLNNIENITDDNLKNILTNIRNNGYKFKQIWGDIIIVKDYSQYQEYTEYVSEDKKIYLDIQNEYANQLYSYKDINDLLDKIIKVEDSINKIKDEKIKNDSIKIYGEMLLLIVEGDEIYVPKVYGEEENKNINESIKQCINQNTNTVTANILDKYIKGIETDNYEYREESIKVADEIRNNIATYFN